MGYYANTSPEGAGLSTCSPDHLRAVEYAIHNRPGLLLQDRKPAELFRAPPTSPDYQLL
ncbi:hypothetical protein MYIN104542_24130 [Mycobacterium intermedium]